MMIHTKHNHLVVMSVGTVLGKRHGQTQESTLVINPLNVICVVKKIEDVNFKQPFDNSHKIQ